MAAAVAFGFLCLEECPRPVCTQLAWRRGLSLGGMCSGFAGVAATYVLAWRRGLSLGDMCSGFAGMAASFGSLECVASTASVLALLASLELARGSLETLPQLTQLLHADRLEVALHLWAPG